MKKQERELFDYGMQLIAAHRSAKAESQGQTTEQAKEAFLSHWGRAVIATEKLLQDGDEELIGNDILPRIDYLLACVCSMIRKSPAIGRYVFLTAQSLARDSVTFARETPPPPWITKLAATEFEVPWLMVNGKPAPGFLESDAALHWGSTLAKRGKSQFNTPQTRAVAAALHHRHWLLPHLSAMTPHKLKSQLKGYQPQDAAELRDLAALPPLSRNTKDQWWRSLRIFIRRNAERYLSEKEKKSIRASLDHDTPAALINEFLKRCKIAFDGLCPAE